MMKKMNKKWADSSYNIIDNENEKACVWLCDPEVWNEYKTNNSSYAIGSPSVGMYMKAFNQWKDNDENSTTLINKVEDANGYSVGANGEYANSGYWTDNNTIEAGPDNIFMNVRKTWCLASPSASVSADGGTNILFAIGYGNCITNDRYNNTIWMCPVVPLDQ